MILNVGLTLFFVLLNAFFVAAEFAIVKVRRSRIDMKVAEGNMFAGIATHMLNHLDGYLSACQLGITIASLALGWIGESVVAEIVRDVMAVFSISLPPTTLHSVSITIAFSLITVLHIVIGEIAPKNYAITQSESVTLLVAVPMRIFYFVFQPIIFVLNNLANAFIRLLGIQSVTVQETHSPEELRYIIRQSSSENQFEISEHELLENVFEFAETTAAQVMVPRSSIVGLDISMSGNQIIDKVMEEGYSRLPVYQESIDNIVGVVYAKDLLTLMHHRDLVILQDILHPPYFISETVMLKKLLRNMQKRRVHIAIVLDEFGGTAGLLTMEDIVEELVGNIQDEYDDEAPALASVSQNVFDLQASAHITDLNEMLPSPLPEGEAYATLGGLINAWAKRVLKVGETIIVAGYECTVLQASPRRIDLVRLRKLS